MARLANLLAQIDLPPVDTPPIDTVAEFVGPKIDWGAISPVLALVVGALVLLVTAALTRKRSTAGVATLFTVVTAGVGLVLSAALWRDLRDDGPRLVLADALSIDGFAVFFSILVCAAIILAALSADDYLRRERLPAAEMNALLLLSGAGGMIMASANDLIVLFLGIEVLSIALYVLAGFNLRREESSEAALKYFVLGAFSSAFLLYGIALVYGATGSTNLFEIATYLSLNALAADGLLLGGMALLLVGLGFKVAAAPFHLWTPDVYQGSPTPITGYMASVAKAAGFAGLLRVFVSGFGLYEQDWTPIIGALAVLTLVAGSFMAIVQTDVKRILAYSSIGHAGYVLVGMQAGTDDGVSGALFYLFTYAVIVLGSFAVVTLVGRAGDAAHSLDDYRGLAHQRPWLALAFTVLLLAQSGMPLTGGFLAKFGVIAAAVEAKSYALAVVAMLAAVVAAYLYLRIIVAMYFAGDDEGAETAPVALPWSANLAIIVSVTFTIAVGVLPSELVEFSRDATLLIGLS